MNQLIIQLLGAFLSVLVTATIFKRYHSLRFPFFPEVQYGLSLIAPKDDVEAQWAFQTQIDNIELRYNDAMLESVAAGSSLFTTVDRCFSLQSILDFCCHYVEKRLQKKCFSLLSYQLKFGMPFYYLGLENSDASSKKTMECQCQNSVAANISYHTLKAINHVRYLCGRLVLASKANYNVQLKSEEFSGIHFWIFRMQLSVVLEYPQHHGLNRFYAQRKLYALQMLLEVQEQFPANLVQQNNSQFL